MECNRLKILLTGDEEITYFVKFGAVFQKNTRDHLAYVVKD
jgi:hypothetical protein